MSAEIIIFGNVIEPDQQVQLVGASKTDATICLWQSEPELSAVGVDCNCAYVDLDDPQFTMGEFLMSLATAGSRIKIIGKARDTGTEMAKKFAPLGVSEILSSSQCLERLRTLLLEVEQIKKPSDKASPTKLVGPADAFIGVSPQMAEIRQTVGILSDVDFPSALILGETGTGKSLICRILHNTGVRAGHNLVEVNCSAIPDELFESELFGHKKGSFTDAKSDKKGLFEFAESGTIFLDEVGNLSASAQAKLLKILEDKKIRPIGAIEDKEINVRVVAATNLDLRKAIDAGAFREDLYFRLNLLTIFLPPLRERPEDVIELVEFYAGYFATNYGKADLSIDPEVMDVLKHHSWPGNIREVCNVVERAILLTRDKRIKLSDIDVAVTKSRITIADRKQMTIDLPPQGVPLEEIESNIVIQVLNMFDWNRTKAAKYLQISRPRLRRMIQKAGMEDDRRQN